MINANTEVLPSQDRNLKYECLLLMDEATAPGRIDALAKAIAYMAGYGLRLLSTANTPQTAAAGNRWPVNLSGNLPQAIIPALCGDFY